MGSDQSVPWYAWQTAKRTATHIAGVRSYKPRNHPKYKDACEVILTLALTLTLERDLQVLRLKS